MPKVIEQDGFKFFFFSNEGNPPEPCHIHVRKGGALAKFWITEKIELDYSSGFNSSELSKIVKIANRNILKIKGAWNEFFL